MSLTVGLTLEMLAGREPLDDWVLDSAKRVMTASTSALMEAVMC